LVTDCHQLKMLASDGKNYLTDAATAETLLRLVQVSPPVPRQSQSNCGLPRWDTSGCRRCPILPLALARTREGWRKLGRSEKWITQRMTVRRTRKQADRLLGTHEVKQGQEFAILTNIIHEEWSGISVQDHKGLKGLESQNLRDHMSEAELIFTALAETFDSPDCGDDRAVSMPPTKRLQRPEQHRLSARV